jgi:hypothetical protein
MSLTKSHVDRVYDLLQQRDEGGEGQEFIQLGRQLDAAVQSGLVDSDHLLELPPQSPAALSWENEVIYVLEWVDVYEDSWPLDKLMRWIGRLLDEAQQDPPAENLER